MLKNSQCFCIHRRIPCSYALNSTVLNNLASFILQWSLSSWWTDRCLPYPVYKAQLPYFLLTTPLPFCQTNLFFSFPLLTYFSFSLIFSPSFFFFSHKGSFSSLGNKNASRHRVLLMTATSHSGNFFGN